MTHVDSIDGDGVGQGHIRPIVGSTLTGRQQSTFFFRRREPICDHLLQVQADQDIFDAFFAIQLYVAALGRQNVAHLHHGDAIVAIHPAHFFHQVGAALYVQPVVWRGDQQMVVPIFHLKSEGFEIALDLGLVNDNAADPFDFGRREGDRPGGRRVGVIVDDALGDGTARIKTHQLGRPPGA